MRKIIAVLGDAIIPENSKKYNIAFETGKTIIDLGYRLQCGGLGGVMRAACAGARSSEKYREGDIIGILPSFDPTVKNEFVDIPIPTGLDIYRNVIVANAAAVIAIGGGSGTLCEIANAWALKRMVIAYKNLDGWCSKVADTKMDERMRYDSIPEDRIFGIESPTELKALFESYLERYNHYHTGITPFN